MLEIGEEMNTQVLYEKIEEYISKKTEIECHLNNGTIIYGKIVQIYDEAYLVDTSIGLCLVYKQALAFIMEV